MNTHLHLIVFFSLGNKTSSHVVYVEFFCKASNSSFIALVHFRSTKASCLWVGWIEPSLSTISSIPFSFFGYLPLLSSLCGFSSSFPSLSLFVFVRFFVSSNRRGGGGVIKKSKNGERRHRSEGVLKREYATQIVYKKESWGWQSRGAGGPWAFSVCHF